MAKSKNKYKVKKRKKSKRIQVNVLLEREIRQMLIDRAIATNTDVSNLVRVYIRRGLGVETP